MPTSRSKEPDWLYDQSESAAPRDKTLGAARTYNEPATASWLFETEIEEKSDFRQFLDNEPPMEEWMIIVPKGKRKADYDF